jgi:hypothetical protein
MKPAEMLKRALVGTQTHTPQPITDDFAKAIARKLEERGIAKVPGIPSPDPEPTWIDNAIEFGRQSKELEAEWEAKRQAELEAATAPQTTAGILANTITGSSSVIPLNGDGILDVVMRAMGGGTANGGNG